MSLITRKVRFVCKTFDPKRSRKQKLQVGGVHSQASEQSTKTISRTHLFIRFRTCLHMTGLIELRIGNQVLDCGQFHRFELLAVLSSRYVKASRTQRKVY